MFLFYGIEMIPLPLLFHTKARESLFMRNNFTILNQKNQ